jgi:hypothetical protein
VSEPAESGGVVVSLKDIYVVVRRLEDTVNAMTPHGQQITDHESRLRSLERWKYSVPASLVAAITAIVTTLITHR